MMRVSVQLHVFLKTVYVASTETQCTGAIVIGLLLKSADLLKTQPQQRQRRLHNADDANENEISDATGHARAS